MTPPIAAAGLDDAAGLNDASGLDDTSGRDVVELHVPCGSDEEAAAIARQTVEDRLAACGNVLPNVRSWFRWEGRVQQDTEALLILKTTAARRSACAAAVRRLHSYDLPAITAAAVWCDEATAAWVRTQTSPEGTEENR